MQAFIETFAAFSAVVQVIGEYSVFYEQGQINELITHLEAWIAFGYVPLFCFVSFYCLKGPMFMVLVVFILLSKRLLHSVYYNRIIFFVIISKFQYKNIYFRYIFHDTEALFWLMRRYEYKSFVYSE